MRMRMVVADPDKGYLDALEEYLTNNFQQRFHFSFFSKKEYLLELINQIDRPVDLLLINPIMLTEDIILDAVNKTILLTDGKVNIDSKGFNSINKYQPCDRLMANVLSDLYSENSFNDEIPRGQAKGKIISVFSPAGGVGKTTIAISTATLLAHLGKRVFYFNLEGISSLNLYFNNDCEYTASNLYYFIKNKKKNLSLKLESLQVKDNGTQVNYIEPTKNILEWEEINEEDVDYLLTELLASGMYDYIIIDLSSGIDLKNLKVLSRSNHVLLITNQNQVALGKADSFLQIIGRLPQGQGKIQPKIIPVINRSIGFQREYFIGDLKVNYLLPEEEALWLNRGQQMIFNSHSSFAKKLYDIIEAIKGE